MRRHRDSLYLRATLPPKKGEVRPRRREIALGVKANLHGLKRAKAEAFRLSADLALGTFDWNDWEKDKPSGTAGDWIDRFYLRYKQNAINKGRTKYDRTWEVDYLHAYKKLDRNKPLDPSATRKIIAQYPVDSRTRKRLVDKFGALFRFAEIPLDLDDLKGTYTIRSVNPRSLPTDEEIEFWGNKISHPEWRWVYWMMATYGLRPQEVWFVDLEEFSFANPKLLLLDGGKTGSRIIFPLPLDWWEKERLWEGSPPQTRSRIPERGKTVSRRFRRVEEIPYDPYCLRHAYARRCLEYGIDPSISAQQMGHAVDIHHRTYLRFIGDRTIEKAWRKAIDRGPVF